ncbi:MAG: response regulator transcription factor [Phycisphaerae bacterium]|nr:response regulator transcription factor [Phycisphaerae bacterium]
MDTTPNAAETSTSESENQGARLLVVDDDVKLCDLVAKYLRPEGFEVEAAHNAGTGIERALSREHVLVILDVMLPGLGGFDILRRIRAQSNIPVLMLSARGEEVDRIVGLEIGADDYLPKPFNPRELVARIRAILRRTRGPVGAANGTGAAERILVGDVEMDFGSRTVRCADRPVQLTGVEFTLLEMLLRAAGSVVDREELSKAVLGRRLMPYDRSLDMHVSNLRKKLGHRIGEVERIKTIRSVGYMYALVADAPGKGNAAAHS